MDRTTLHERLEALAARIADARRELDQRGHWNEGHRLAAGEMEARYRFLRDELASEVSAAEAHGHHVSALERSVRAWIDGLSLETRR